MTELTLLERTTIVTRLFSAVQFYFAHWQDTDFDIDAALPDLLRMAIETPDRFQFGLGVMKFISRLNNSHTWYRDPQFAEHTQNRAYTLTANGMVEKSYVDGLKPGDVLTHLDGKPLEDWYREIRPYMNASSERIARILFSVFLPTFVPPCYDVRTDDRRVITIDHTTASPPSEEQETTGKWIEEKRAAYMNIPSFNLPKFEDRALDYVREFKDAETLIIDLRECGGGNTPQKLIDALMTQPYRTWSEGTPQNFALFHYRQMEFFRHPMLVWDSPLITPSPVYHGKIILLVGRYVGSAAEDFVLPFKTSGRAALVGETTFGSTGQPWMYHFENGIWLAVGAKRAYFPDGSRYEGYGIPPDVEVKITAEGLRAGRDEVLERALEMVK